MEEPLEPSLSYLNRSYLVRAIKSLKKPPTGLMLAAEFCPSQPGLADRTSAGCCKDRFDLLARLIYKYFLLIHANPFNDSGGDLFWADLRPVESSRHIGIDVTSMDGDHPRSLRAEFDAQTLCQCQFGRLGRTMAMVPK